MQACMVLDIETRMSAMRKASEEDGALNKAGASEAAHADLHDIRSALRGDGDAYARLVRRHQGGVNAYLRHFAPETGVREELVHDVFVEAYLSLKRFRGSGLFAHWLRTIATRVGYRHWRRLSDARRQRQASHDDARAAVASHGNSAESQSRVEYLRFLLGRLAPRDRLVLTLLYLEELDVRETAQTLEWSVSMVKVQAYRARRKFRTILEAANWSRENE